MTGTFQGVNTLQFTPDNKHCYAYSGGFGSTTSSQTMLDFTTNSEYIVGKLITSGAIGFDTPGGLKSAFKVSLNNTPIAFTLVDNQTDHSASVTKLNLILPPFSTLKVEVDSDDTNAGAKSTALFTGKVKGSITQVEL
tara:strand:+ start:459 stop:872 length:414 start_codon:yes stop_codon:yes gene_type:complete